MLLLSGPAQSGSLDLYWANRSYAEAAACLDRGATRCGVELDRYVDAATHVLRSGSTPQTGQELRLRAMQRKLLAAIAQLHAAALQTVTVAPQSDAEALDRVLQQIDALLGLYHRRPETVTAPTAPDAPVRVVELIADSPETAAPDLHTLPAEVLTVLAEIPITDAATAPPAAAESMLSLPAP